ncbi:tRNA lysidine(34) synthetase TilS [Phaeobacter sp. PT47_59]|uniref:tRNA lysidine(34) synthetase TilS n=1 Tax=Phaeobacter sp. PT47_59 TaxID=3029979 RepID=UPI0023800144|nr:tRNA lysidine(34) synthetase TilS [Phaeobacter sp. PT47_59]MDE4173306.1 tRNA lysidine(34) synthetase TilS [Phaeobacter sp. PT47_59]
MTQDTADILVHLRAGLPASLPERVGVAVSGGSDSVALLHLLHRCLHPQGVEISAVTVDHGLRPASAAEAQQVAGLARDLGVSHDILHWHEGPSGGNLQDQARQARYALMADWAAGKGISRLALGHTADDQAETLLMRLKRASGVSGLSAMSVTRRMGAVTLWRPLLELRRAELRQYLLDQGVSWIEDPSNQDPRFDRVRMRAALPLLEDLGLGVEALVTVAQNMAQARQALDHYADRAARDLARVRAGAISLDGAGFAALPDEIAYRLLSAAIIWVAGAQYPPRRAPMMAALAAARSGRGRTLSGARILCRKGQVWICREAQALRDKTCGADRVWDSRWRLFAENAEACQIRALGPEGLRHCPDWRDLDLPGPVLEVTPALWCGDELCAAPLAGSKQGCRAELIRGEEEFHASFLSH